MSRRRLGLSGLSLALALSPGLVSAQEQPADNRFIAAQAQPTDEAPAPPLVAETPAPPVAPPVAEAPAVPPALVPPAPPIVAQTPPAEPPSARQIQIIPTAPVAPPPPPVVEAPAAPPAPPVAEVPPAPVSPPVQQIPVAPVAPPVAEAPPAETPPAVVDARIREAYERQYAYLLGTWVYEDAGIRGQAGRFRLIMRYNKDGNFVGVVQFFDAYGRKDVKVSGAWKLEPISVKRFVLTTQSAETGSRITLEVLDDGRMLNLTNNVLMTRIAS